MDNITRILFEERKRLENCVTYSSERVLQVSAPATYQIPQKNHLTGEDVMVSYIDLDRFTPEQREQFDTCVKRDKEHRARLCVFENFVRGMTPQATVQSFNRYVSPLHEINDVSIPCNCIGLDDKGSFSKYSIKVGGNLIESPKEMSFDNYRQLYVSSLSNLLQMSLGNGLSDQEIRQELQNACAEVYLNQQNQVSYNR